MFSKIEIEEQGVKIKIIILLKIVFCLKHSAKIPNQNVTLVKRSS